MTQTKRCFIAVNLPERLKQNIFETLSKKIPRKECKVVEQENLHITMLFLGYLAEETIKEIQGKMNVLREFGAFDVELNDVGHFRGRVFWLGVKSGSDELKKIAEKLQELLGIKDEKFSSHLTIARNKFLRGKETDELLKKLQGANFSATFRVESIDFMESVLSPKGPKYEKLFSVSLNPF